MDPRETFDLELAYREAPNHLATAGLNGKRFEVCTVRQRELLDLPLGDLFWLLKAALAKAEGAQVVVTDFYDKPQTPNQSVAELMKILGLDPEEGTVLRKAEEVPRSLDFWKRFCAYVREHRTEQETWETIGTVREGIQAVLDSDGEAVPESMERFLEELSVWVEAIDEDAIQMLHHEVENTKWVRRLYPEAKKKFVKVDLPFQNEYRGKYKEDLAGGERVIHQRRIQDLSAKLAQTEDEFTKDEDPSFYRFLFQELIQILNKNNERAPCEYPLKYQYDPDKLSGTDTELYPDRWLEANPGHPEAKAIKAMVQAMVADETIRDLVKLDPSLLPFYLDTLPRDPSSKDESTWLFDDPAQEQRYLEGVLLLTKNKRRNGGSLKEMIPFLSKLSSLGKELLMTNAKLRGLCLSPGTTPQEVGELWLCLLSDPHLRSDPRIYTHPAVDRLAEELEPEDSTWLALKQLYFERLKSKLPSMVGFDCPLMVRLLKGWSQASEGQPLLQILDAQRAQQERDLEAGVSDHIREKDKKVRNRFKKHFEDLLGRTLGEDFQEY